MNANCVGTHEDAMMISDEIAEDFTHYQVANYGSVVNKKEVLLKKDRNKNRYKCFSDIGETNKGISICTKRRINDTSALADLLDREKYIAYRKIISGKIILPGKGKKEFDNIYIEFSVLTKYVGIPGTKLAGRFAEKGVVGYIVPVEQMPITEDGVRVHVILSSIAPFKRLIPGSIYEPEIGWIGREVIRSGIRNNLSRAAD